MFTRLDHSKDPGRAVVGRDLDPRDPAAELDCRDDELRHWVVQRKDVVEIGVRRDFRLGRRPDLGRPLGERDVHELRLATVTAVLIELIVAGEALDALLKELGVDERDVLDRTDRRTTGPSDDLGELVRRQIEAVQVRAAEIEEQRVQAEYRAARLEEERKRAAAVLVATSGEELTERQRQTLSLVLSGMSADEIATVLEISRETVLRHKRNALAHGAGLRVALQGEDALTMRERQVAGLAAEGLSNREIAEQLVVTQKTVEWHLQHTYRKLGVSSRQALRDALQEPRRKK